MRKFMLLAAIATSALMAGCAQSTSSTAMNENCVKMTTEEFVQAVERGECEIDVTTAAGGEESTTNSNPGGDGDNDHGKDPDPDPDPDTDPDPGKDPDPEGEPDPDTDPGDEPDRPTTEPDKF